MPGKAQRGDKFGRLLAQIGEDAALNDAKQGLVGAGFCGQAALGPGMGALHGALVVGPVVRRRAFIKGHDDIRAELFLDFDRFFGGEAVHRAVDVAFKGDPIFVDLAHLCQ